MSSDDTRSLTIAEIAGRDSVAAAVAAVRDRGFSRLLPTIALTGTETGDAQAPLRAIATLERLLDGECEVLDPLYLENPGLWSALNARFAAAIAERYGVYSPCLACHLYMHLLRVPVSWQHGGAPVIAGERDTHDGRTKLSQTTGSIDAAVRVLAYADVELLQPIRGHSGDQVAALVGHDWDEGGDQLGCLLSGNYKALDGTVTYDEAGYERYLAEFFEPVGRAVIDAWRAESPVVGDASHARPEWHAVVRGVLGEGSVHTPHTADV